MVRGVLVVISYCIPLKWLLFISGKKIILPFYHIISDEELPYAKNLHISRSIKKFEQDMKFLSSNFQSITIDALQKTVEQKESILPSFHTTFDDGLSQVYTIALPILEKYKIAATVFLNTAFIDNQELFYRFKSILIINELKTMNTSFVFPMQLGLLSVGTKNELIRYLSQITYIEKDILDTIASNLKLDFSQYISEKQPYLSTKQIEKWLKKGMTIGTHSLDHPKFSDISLTSQKKQLTESAQEIENKFGVIDHFFSFPFTDDKVTDEFFNYMYDEEGIKLSFGVSGIKDDFFARHLHRIPVERYHYLSMKSIIKSELLAYSIKKRLGGNIVYRTKTKI